MGLVITLQFANMAIPVGVFVALIIVTGMMGTARQLLDRNTLAQVLTGWACGFFGVLLINLVFKYHLLSL